MSGVIYIYALCEPDTEEVRYVGQSIYPQARLTQHMAPSALNKTDCPKNAWLRQLRAQGLRPGLIILEAAADTGYVACEREAYWISHYEKAGAKLTNINLSRNALLWYCKTHR